MRIAFHAFGLIALGTCIAGNCVDAAQSPTFPKELRGRWDTDLASCTAANSADSDSPIHIESRVLHGYENNDALRSIARLSSSPPTWRVVTISDIAPAEIQGQADIYVLNEHNLTITNGERASRYVRCK